MKNYQEAADWCDAQNRRLCTKAELEASTSCTRYRLMGCNVDATFIWTSTSDKDKDGGAAPAAGAAASGSQWGCTVKGKYGGKAMKIKKNVATMEDCQKFCESVGDACVAVQYFLRTKQCSALRSPYTKKFLPASTIEVANRNEACGDGASPAAGAGESQLQKVEDMSSWGCVVQGKSPAKVVGETVSHGIDPCFEYCETIPECKAVAYTISQKKCSALDKEIGSDITQDKGTLLASRYGGCKDPAKTYPKVMESFTSLLQEEENGDGARTEDWFINKRPADIVMYFTEASVAGSENNLSADNFFYGLMGIGCIASIIFGYKLAYKHTESHRAYFKL